MLNFVQIRTKLWQCIRNKETDTYTHLYTHAHSVLCIQDSTVCSVLWLNVHRLTFRVCFSLSYYHVRPFVCSRVSYRCRSCSFVRKATRVTVAECTSSTRARLSRVDVRRRDGEEVARARLNRRCTSSSAGQPMSAESGFRRCVTSSSAVRKKVGL